MLVSSICPFGVSEETFSDIIYTGKREFNCIWLTFPLSQIEPGGWLVGLKSPGMENTLLKIYVVVQGEEEAVWHPNKEMNVAGGQERDRFAHLQLPRSLYFKS